MPGLVIISFIAGAIVAGAVATALSRRRIERTREAERRARAAERLAEIGSMTAGLAHEIKNPLSTLVLNAQLLDEGIAELGIAEEEKGRLSRRVGSLRREADRLRGILTDFLDYAGEIRFDPKPVDLNTLVEELADFCLPQAEQAGVRLRVTLDESDGPLVVEVDAGHAKQAVLNLLLNAIQAMSGEANDGASAERELLLRTSRGASTGGQRLARVHVTDTGPGIAPEALDRVFQPYFSTRPGGTGLGLPTTRRLVEGQHGRIDVNSEPGKGTEFTLSFPMVPTV